MHIDQEIGEAGRLSLSLTTESTQAAQATNWKKASGRWMDGWIADAAIPGGPGCSRG